MPLVSTVRVSRHKPWKTLKKASETAQAVDIITLLPGIYDGELRPVNNGTSKASIIFCTAPRLGATLIGPPDGGMTIW